MGGVSISASSSLHAAAACLDETHVTMRMRGGVRQHQERRDSAAQIARPTKVPSPDLRYADTQRHMNKGTISNARTGFENGDVDPEQRVWVVGSQQAPSHHAQIDALQRALNNERAHREQAIAAACEAAWELHEEQQRRIIQLEADLAERERLLLRLDAAAPGAMEHVWEEERRAATVLQLAVRRRQAASPRTRVQRSTWRLHAEPQGRWLMC